jgi:hypothetical protein
MVTTPTPRVHIGEADSCGLRPPAASLSRADHRSKVRGERNGMSRRATAVLLTCAQALLLAGLASGCAAIGGASNDYAQPSMVRGSTITYRLRWAGDDPMLDARHYCARLNQSFRLRGATNMSMSFDCVDEPEALAPSAASVAGRAGL